MQVIGRYSKDYLVMLVALHDLNLAAHYADRIALMVVGNIKAMGTPKEVLLPELIADAYCLTVQVVQNPFLDVPLVLPETKWLCHSERQRRISEMIVQILRRYAAQNDIKPNKNFRDCFSEVLLSNYSTKHCSTNSISTSYHLCCLRWSRRVL